MSRTPDWLRLPDAQEMARATYVSRMALRGMLQSRLPQMAAALAYRTLFGLLPISIVALVIVRMFVGDDDLKRLVEQAIRFTGVAEVIEAEIQDATGEPSALGTAQRSAADNFFAMLEPRALSPATGSSLAFVPIPAVVGQTPLVSDETEGADPTESQSEESAEALVPSLEATVDRIVREFGTIRFDAIGLIGGLLLIYAALAMSIEIERCFNQVCRAQRGRSWVRRITQYWTLMTLGAILIALTFLVSVQFREWVRAMAGEGDALGRFIVGAVGFIVTVAISSGLLSLAYMILPNRRLRLRPVLAGATVAAIAWEAAKWGFTQYIGISTNSTYAALYGSLALIPLFMLWVFLTWLIVLFGLQVAYGVQMLEDGVPQQDNDEQSLVLAGPGVMIDAAAAIARRFGDGLSARTSDVANELALASDQTSRIIDSLEQAGFVRQIENGGGFTLSRPADKIQLADIAAAARLATPPGSASAELSEATVQALGKATLQSRLTESPEPDAGAAEATKDAPCPETKTSTQSGPKPAGGHPEAGTS
ncbi:MAG: YihY/virulence factor BrkB family protein [Phycisphaerales bacterium]